MSTAAAPPLQIDLGSDPGVIRVDQPRLALPPRDALLLARLLFDGPQPRAGLAAWLWPQVAPASAMANLRQRLKRLQDASDSALLRLDGVQVALAPGVLSALWPAPAADDPALLDAPLLPGLGAQRPESADPAIQAWLGGARQRLRQQRRAAALARAQALEDAHAVDAALPLAQWLVADDPDDAPALRLLMRLHHAKGDAAQALRAFRAHQQRVRRQLGTEADARTRELAETIAAAAVPAPSAPAPVAAPAPAPGPWLPPDHPLWALLGRPPQRVQRDAAWAQLQALARSGGRAWLLGPGGVGKSRLAHDFCDALGVPLRLACRPGQQALPYSLLAALVRGRLAAAQALPAAARAELARLAPELGSAAPGPLVPALLLPALQAVLAPVAGCAAPAPEALFIDDLHHADAASLELLPALLAPLRSVLLALRPDEAPPALREWLARDGTDGPPVERIELGPFGAEGVAALLATVGLPGMVPADWAPLLLNHTGGHPFLLLQTLRALARGPCPPGAEPPERLPSPPQLRELLLQRLQGLSPLARQLAELAALAGEHFSARMATQALGGVAQQAGQAWAELQAGGYLGTANFGQARLHDLVAEALCSALPPPLATQRHRQVAAALQALGPVPAARLAHHWAEAGEPRRAARLHERAAADAQRLGRVHERVAELDRAAVQWVLAHEPARAFEARAQAAEARITHQQLQEGLAQAQALQDAAADLVQQAAAQRLLAMAHAFGYQHEQALRWATDSHAAAVALARPDWQADTAGLAAVAAVGLGRPALARDWLARAHALPVAQLGWRTQLTRCGTRSHVLVLLGDAEGAMAALNQALVLSHRPDTRAERAAFLANGASLAMKLGLAERALDYALQGQALAQPLGAHIGAVTWLNAEVNVALGRVMVGELDLAREGLERVLEKATDPGLSYWRGTIENHLAWLWIQLGQPARALQRLQAQADSLQPAHLMRRWALRVDLQRLCGMAAALPPPPPEDPVDLGVLGTFVVARHAGDEPVARAPAMQALHERLRAQGMRGSATWVQVLWLQAVSEQPPAQWPADLPEQALALWPELQQRSCLAAYRPEVLVSLATVLQTVVGPEAAAPVRAQARVWVEQAAQRLIGTPWHESFVRRNRVNAALLGSR